MLFRSGIVLEKEQIDRIKRYNEELIYWNSKVNLISRKDEENVLERHFLHSLSVLKYGKLNRNAKCLDIGTGGGLPGIPLAIAREDLSFTLIDSISKKIKITEMLAKHTGLRNIKVINSRVEDLLNDKKNLGYFDYIFSRAVGKIDLVISLSYKLLKPNGKYIFYKGGNLNAEKRYAQKRFPNLITEEIRIDLFGTEWFKTEDKKLVVCSFKNKS